MVASAKVSRIQFLYKLAEDFTRLSWNNQRAVGFRLGVLNRQDVSKLDNHSMESLIFYNAVKNKQTREMRNLVNTYAIYER